MALRPIPVTGTSKVVFPSALVWLITLTFALEAGGEGTDVLTKGGHFEGGTVVGIQVQLCCGENMTVIVQLCCGPRENDEPAGFAQLSCSLKLGMPLKSLPPNGLALTD